MEHFRDIERLKGPKEDGTLFKIADFLPGNEDNPKKGQFGSRLRRGETFFNSPVSNEELGDDTP